MSCNGYSTCIYIYIQMHTYMIITCGSPICRVTALLAPDSGSVAPAEMVIQRGRCDRL